MCYCLGLCLVRLALKYSFLKVLLLTFLEIPLGVPCVFDWVDNLQVLGLIWVKRVYNLLLIIYIEKINNLEVPCLLKVLTLGLSHHVLKVRKRIFKEIDVSFGQLVHTMEGECLTNLVAAI